MAEVAEAGRPLGPIDSVWATRHAVVARLVSATWRHQGDGDLAPGTRVRYLEFKSLYDPCSGYDWAWHFFRILDGPATGRRMVLYSAAFDPPLNILPLVRLASGRMETGERLDGP